MAAAEAPHADAAARRETCRFFRLLQGVAAG